MLSMDNPSMCRLGSFPQICSPPDRTQDFVSATLLFSGYTSSRFMLRRVSGEQRGGLSKFCVGSGGEHGEMNLICTYSGGIRTYLYLLASRCIYRITVINYMPSGVNLYYLASQNE